MVTDLIASLLLQHLPGKSQLFSFAKMKTVDQTRGATRSDGGSSQNKMCIAVEISIFLDIRVTKKFLEVKIMQTAGVLTQMQAKSSNYYMHNMSPALLFFTPNDSLREIRTKLTSCHDVSSCVSLRWTMK